MNIDEALRLIRIWHDISQKDLAAKLGISKSWVCEIESGKKCPTIPLVQKFAEYFGIEVSTIFAFAEYIECQQNINLSTLKMLINWYQKTKQSTNQ